MIALNINTNISNVILGKENKVICGIGMISLFLAQKAKKADVVVVDLPRKGCDEIQPVDMFPHSVHVENVAVLTKK